MWELDIDKNQKKGDDQPDDLLKIDWENGAPVRTHGRRAVHHND